jgi:hypothetical protein
MVRTSKNVVFLWKNKGLLENGQKKCPKSKTLMSMAVFKIISGPFAKREYKN